MQFKFYTRKEHQFIDNTQIKKKNTIEIENQQT